MRRNKELFVSIGICSICIFHGVIKTGDEVAERDQAALTFTQVERSLAVSCDLELDSGHVCAVTRFKLQAVMAEEVIKQGVDPQSP
nr:hypothetical protein [Tanacetum cinerariifolium]